MISTVVALALGIGLTTAGWAASGPTATAPLPPPPRPHFSLLTPARLALEAADAPGNFITVDGARGTLAEVGPGSPIATRQAATFIALPGLTTTRSPTSPPPTAAASPPAASPAPTATDASPSTSGSRNCFSFRTADGRYLHDAAGRLRLDHLRDTTAFRRAATFCLRDGFAPGSALLEESGKRGAFVRHTGPELRVAEGDPHGCSFLVRGPLAP